MAKGRPWRSGEKEKIIRSVQQYLQLGYSYTKACGFAHFPVQTFNDWLQADESLRIECDSLQNMVTQKARMNIKEAIENKDKDLSKWWVEKKEREEFGNKVLLGTEDDSPLELTFN